VSRFSAVVFMGASLLAAAPAPAQKPDWPVRPVRFIVPFPPAGSVDPLARLVAARLTPALGQQFIVDNRPGASGTLGTALAAKANPDGYTFVFVFDSHAVNPSLYPNLPFDTAKDLVPVMLVATAPYTIVTGAAKPYKGLADVIKAAKAKPDTVTYGSVGAGTLSHLMTILLQQRGGFSLVHVPYAGGGPMTVQVLGGQIELGVGSVALLTPHVKGGRIRALATTGERRSAALPDVGTVAEQGISGFSAYAWWGILGTTGSPKPVLAKFHAELTKAFNQPDLRKQLTEQLGMDLVVSGPGELQKFILAEMARWGKLVKDQGIRGD
jgi:tripartite-type tricarboxylate transporter receptor subunit TctC